MLLTAFPLAYRPGGDVQTRAKLLGWHLHALAAHEFPPPSKASLALNRLRRTFAWSACPLRRQRASLQPFHVSSHDVATVLFSHDSSPPSDAQRPIFGRVPHRCSSTIPPRPFTRNEFIVSNIVLPAFCKTIDKECRSACPEEDNRTEPRPISRSLPWQSVA